MESNGALDDIDSRNRSVVYTRWGRKSCPSSADMVLSGNRTVFTKVLDIFYKHVDYEPYIVVQIWHIKNMLITFLEEETLPSTSKYCKAWLIFLAFPAVMWLTYWLTDLKN